MTTEAKPSQPTRTAADLLVECLEAEGCEWVFSVPGEEILDVLDALSRSPSIRHVTTRHEQGAAFMADVYGRLTGRSAVALATLGPGATNLITGIADAFLDRAPMVAITGQASSAKLHKEAHQVVDIVQMFAPVTKWNTRVERVDAIPEIVRKAFRVASLEKPGPTHIELPENLAATAPESGDAIRPLPPTLAYFPEPTDQAIEHAARLISVSERPLVLAGNGVIRRRAAPEVVDELVQRDADLHLHHAGPPERARQPEELRPRGLRRAERERHRELLRRRAPVHLTRLLSSATTGCSSLWQVPIGRQRRQPPCLPMRWRSPRTATRQPVAVARRRPPAPKLLVSGCLRRLRRA